MLTIFSNRPISPHLTIYLPQTLSLFSIWHRLSAVTLILYIMISIYVLKFYFWVPLIELNYFLQFIYIVWKSKLTKFFISLALFYHMINGLRHIKWNLGYILENKNIKNSVIIFFIFLFLLQFLNIY